MENYLPTPLDKEPNKNSDRFNSILENIKKDYPNISNYMKTSITFIKANKEYILNTLKYNYTNGVIEGINNKIKVIKRIAFGYRSFYHFKARILITQGLLKLQINKQESSKHFCLNQLTQVIGKLFTNTT